ncbi:MAG: rod shape-determining protein MreD [Gammaproteobacteria bacterium RIFCSPHIGHO2_12_FULL_40_19]|nr:MAG: rod shape-determining protein MreD [Gammaproteobacteria bacterium RIFCSPHIGHO2_12_FULL_40_19]
MRVIKTTNYFLMIISFLIAMILTLLPLPAFAVWLRPQWIFAFLLFWVLSSPMQCGIGVAWIVGVMVSLVTGTPFAEQAIVFVLLTYLVLKVHPIIAHMLPWQQAGAVALLAILNALLQGLILGFTGHTTHIALYSLSALTTALIWPGLSVILNRFRPRAYIH